MGTVANDGTFAYTFTEGSASGPDICVWVAPIACDPNGCILVKPTAYAMTAAGAEITATPSC
jgi:hypothetical protein